MPETAITDKSRRREEGFIALRGSAIGPGQGWVRDRVCVRDRMWVRVRVCVRCRVCIRVSV